jgi:hypothetical protein
MVHLPRGDRKVQQQRGQAEKKFGKIMLINTQ